MSSSYSDKLKDPRWQRKRLEVLERAEWKCECCGAVDRTLHVHHGHYDRGADPWEYDLFTLWSLCEECHEDAEIRRRDYYFELAFVKPWLLSPYGPLHSYSDEDRKTPRRGIIMQPSEAPHKAF